MPRPENKRRRTIKGKMDCTAIKELLSPKTLNKFRFALVIFWILIGVMLCGAFSEMENSEPAIAREFLCRNFYFVMFLTINCLLRWSTTVTAITNTSRQNQNCHGNIKFLTAKQKRQNQIPHGKTKMLTAKP